MNQVLSITKALSDGNRLRILMALSAHSELCACQITELLAITGAPVSRHLSILTHAGLISSRKAGRWINFRLAERPDLAPLLSWLKTNLEPTEQTRLDRTALSEIVAKDPEDICRKQRGDACCPAKPVQQKP